MFPSNLATWYTAVSCLAVAAFVWSRGRSRKRNPRNLPCPPGPKGLPLIGTLFDLPSTEAWVLYDEWKEKYGDMVYFETMGLPFLILGSVKRANDLLEARSAKYPSRMQTTMLSREMMGWDMSFGFQPYGPWWRRHRRLFHQHFNQGAVYKYKDIQSDETRGFIQRLLDSPSSDNLVQNIRRTFAGTVMRITYGIPVVKDDDDYTRLAEVALLGLSEAGHPGSFLVDLVPILRYIPAWFPGAAFQRKAAYWKSINREVRKMPFRIVKEQMNAGTAPPSVASQLINRLPPEDDEGFPVAERIVENVTAVAYAAGADTTVSSVHAFFLAMAMHPHVLKKAQEEIDRVVGPNRLPDYEDQASLHYIKAIHKEMLRWHMVAPLGIAHYTTEDDEYDGYFIPKGTVVMANAWSILHDKTVFEDHLDFKPERYIKNGVFNEHIPDPSTSGAFGFGRRICPGRYLAENSLYLVIATTVAVFNITPPLDENGKQRALGYAVTDGLVSHPVPFDVVIKPRSAQAEKLARDWVSLTNA